MTVNRGQKWGGPLLGMLVVSLVLNGCGSPAIQDLTASAQKTVTAVGKLVPGSLGTKSSEDALMERSAPSTGGKFFGVTTAPDSALPASKKAIKLNSAQSGDASKNSISPDFTQSPEEVQKLLLRSNPDACSATSDASYGEMAEIYSQLVANFAGMYLANRIKPDGELKKQMREFKPLFRELSRNTNWMPQSVERMVGEAYFKHHQYVEYTPPTRAKKEIRLIEEVVKPAFESMKKFAKEEVRSDTEFELHIVQDVSNTKPAMLAGGLLIVPSGMLTALRDSPQADQIIAFMISHEFSHALRRHMTKMTQLRLVDSITALNQFKELVGSTRSGFDRLKNPFEMFKFSSESVASMVNHTCKTADAFKVIEHNQEFEADVCGALLLKQFSESSKRDYSAVRGFSAYLRTPSLLSVPSTGGDSCLAYPSHPASKERLQKLTSYEVKLDLSAK